METSPQRLELTQGPIDLLRVHQAVRDPRCGGTCCFVGTTRDHHQGKPVEKLAYEAYEAMARQELERLAQDLRERFPAVVGVCLVHRLGEVPLAEASVAVAVSAPHRDEAFSACRWGIDALKARLPVWKKESYGDGSDPRWVANREAGQQVQP